MNPLRQFFVRQPSIILQRHDNFAINSVEGLFHGSLPIIIRLKDLYLVNSIEFHEETKDNSRASSRHDDLGDRASLLRSPGP